MSVNHKYWNIYMSDSLNLILKRYASIKTWVYKMRYAIFKVKDWEQKRFVIRGNMLKDTECDNENKVGYYADLWFNNERMSEWGKWFPKVTSDWKCFI